MNRKRRAAMFTLLLFCFLVLATARRARSQDVPRYKVDPFWPKEYQLILKATCIQARWAQVSAFQKFVLQK